MLTLLVGLGALIRNTAGNVAQEGLVTTDALDVEATAGRDSIVGAGFLSCSVVSSWDYVVCTGRGLFP